MTDTNDNFFEKFQEQYKETFAQGTSDPKSAPVTSTGYVQNHYGNGVCPHCGRCRHCGNGGYWPVGPYWGQPIITC